MIFMSNRTLWGEGGVGKKVYMSIKILKGHKI